MPERDTGLNQKPQINISRPTSVRMWLVFICSFLAVLQSALSDSGASLVVALCALCPAVLTELLVTHGKDGFAKIKDGSAAASAMVFALLLPNRIPPVYAVLGAVFAIAVVKHSFGGLGSNWLNPGIGGWLFLRFSWPEVFSKALAGSPLALVSESMRNGFAEPRNSPLGLIRLSGAGDFSGGALDARVSAFLNDTVFSFFGAELPSGYIDLLVSGGAPGIIADRGILALLLGTLVITALEVSRSWIPAAYLGLFGILVRVFGDLPFEGLLFNGDVLFAFFSGATLAAAFILMADPVTSAKSRAGILFTVLLGAFLSWVFRYRGLEFYGAFFAAALVNALTPLIRSFEGKWFYSRKQRVSQ
ncbi:MAG: RnfABCDGE type electron transport complex subunit D [Treponema sp.]|jgi:electron transport complex protein RnfD|nr:RnfABCDGE type electron transport complex subunit D [Treponema sp.]